MKVLLVQWNAQAAGERAKRLEQAGFVVTCETKNGREAYRKARHDRPDVVVLDLDEKAAHSRHTASALSELSETPRIVFVGGIEDARERAAKEVPAAEFVADEELEEALRTATG